MIHVIHALLNPTSSMLLHMTSMKLAHPLISVRVTWPFPMLACLSCCWLQQMRNPPSSLKRWECRSCVLASKRRWSSINSRNLRKCKWLHGDHFSECKSTSSHRNCEIWTVFALCIRSQGLGFPNEIRLWMSSITEWYWQPLLVGDLLIATRLDKRHHHQMNVNDC